MPADFIRLVRHGEVHNPEHILYGRIPGYHLSELGHAMADAAAASLAGHPIVALYASPLQRAQESAEPWATRYSSSINTASSNTASRNTASIHTASIHTASINTDERIIEPYNWFEGRRFEFPAALKHPSAWPRLINPLRPSWGEPYTTVLARMLSAINEAWAAADGGEVVMVSHQLPIVMVARSVKGQRLFHDPRKRRCTLSSITTLRREGDRFVEVDYQEPAGELLARSVDLGAV